jgi:outer membrane protein assembly factor BamD
MSSKSAIMTLFHIRNCAIDGAQRRFLRGAAAAFLAGALVTACGDSEEEITYVERPVEQIYNTAMDQLEAGNYKEAAQQFDEVERQHPYSVWATRAQLMAAFTLYQDNKYDEAINTLDRFIQLHPGHDDVPYAYYLRGLSYYEQISDVGRDQAMTERALGAFQELVRRYPDSRYARDASLKMDLARDHLAGKHMEIGRWYQAQGYHLAAINRFRTVVEDYQTTTHVPEALHRLVESYMILGVQDEAKATAAVLGHNYPGNQWYVDSYALLTGEDLTPEEDKESWIASVWNDIF